MRRYLSIALCLLIVLNFIEVTSAAVPTQPLWGDPKCITYDADHNVYVNNNPDREAWRHVGDMATVLRLTRPERIPAKKVLVFKLRSGPLMWRPNGHLIALAGTIQYVKPPKRGRFVLINVEQTAAYDLQYRTWPHLGILFVGTAARSVGWEVILWDELVQGHVSLPDIVQPGDVVGLSLIVTGIERGVGLAREAKQLGARYVVAGNDSAIFRANQLLSMPDKPIDAVFVSNSLTPVRQLFTALRQDPSRIPQINGIQTTPSRLRLSNQVIQLKAEMAERKAGKASGTFDGQDVFIVPDLSLFPASYWETVWGNYRTVFGHKHSDPATVRNALGLLAHGCTKTAGYEVCDYCSIFGVADIRIPTHEYLQLTIERYAEAGITHLFNATDSAYEMRVIPERLAEIGSPFRSMTIYGRAQGLARSPELIEAWQRVAPERLVINVGLDSGDEGMLSRGIGKSNPTASAGSRLEENRQAVRIIRTAGASLHFSLIFGSPGETRESCERSLDFMRWAIAELGTQLDTVESDIWWLNFGSPSSRVFEDYGYAQRLAAMAGKEISHEEWQKEFAAHRDALSVPWSAEEAWYRYFTGITADEANHYNDQVAAAMAEVGGSIHGRAFKPFQA